MKEQQEDKSILSERKQEDKPLMLLTCLHISSKHKQEEKQEECLLDMQDVRKSRTKTPCIT